MRTISSRRARSSARGVAVTVRVTTGVTPVPGSSAASVATVAGRTSLHPRRRRPLRARRSHAPCAAGSRAAAKTGSPSLPLPARAPRSGRVTGRVSAPPTRQSSFVSQRLSNRLRKGNTRPRYAKSEFQSLPELDSRLGRRRANRLVGDVGVEAAPGQRPSARARPRSSPGRTPRSPQQARRAPARSSSSPAAVARAASISSPWRSRASSSAARIRSLPQPDSSRLSSAKRRAKRASSRVPIAIRWSSDIRRLVLGDAALAQPAPQLGDAALLLPERPQRQRQRLLRHGDRLRRPCARAPSALRPSPRPALPPPASRDLGGACAEALSAASFSRIFGLDLVCDLGVLGQELLGVVAALAEPQLPVGEERARLLDQVVLEPEVDQAALLGDADAVLDVELGLAERRRDLVLDDLDPARGCRPPRCPP